METELARISQPEAKAAFIADFSAADYYQLLEGWNAKLKWAAASQFKWVRLDATKPALGAQGSLVDCSQVVVKHDAYGGAVSDLPCDIRREEGKSLVIGGPSLAMLEGKTCNPL